MAKKNGIWYYTKRTIIAFIEIALIVFIFGLAYLSGKVLGVGISEYKNGAIVHELDDYKDFELPTIVYDKYGEMITQFTTFNRELVSFDNIPNNLIDAFLVTEDKRFFEHDGLDYVSIIRAALNNYKARKIVEGGSTISQQLAKLFFTDKARTFKRKIYEAWIAVSIEKRYSKKEILEKYLNKIYFGHGVYGVTAATNYFFGKKLEDISYIEAAMLASIPSAPNKYSPFQNPDSARQRHKTIVNRLIHQGYLSEPDANQQFKSFWLSIRKRMINVSSYAFQKYRKDKAPYFSEYVRTTAEKYLTDVLGYKKEFLYKGGLQIYTTIDLEKQAMARKHLQSQLKRQDGYFNRNNRGTYYYLNKNYSDLFNFLGQSFLDSNYLFRYKEKLAGLFTYLQHEARVLELAGDLFALDRVDRLMEKYNKSKIDDNLGRKSEGALISLEPKTGRIIAMVGGRQFTAKNQFNRAVYARRQPGSTFKAFLYGAALQSRNFHPNTIVAYKCPYEDCPTVTVRQALKFSLNTTARQLIDNIGPKRVINFAAPMLGIEKERLPADPSLALGSGEVTPLELCRGLAVYANDGREVIPIAITKILDRYGKVLVDFEEEIIKKGGRKQLIKPDLAYLMTSLLKGVIRGGTATRGVLGSGFYRPAAGKTGSTNDYKDAWFVGYTPNLATAVWVGFDKGMSLGYRQYGGEVAAPVWAKFMRDAHKDLPLKYFKRPTRFPPAVKRAPWVKEPLKARERGTEEELKLDDLDVEIFKRDDLFSLTPEEVKKIKKQKAKSLEKEIKKLIKKQTKENIIKDVRKTTEEKIKKALEEGLTENKSRKKGKQQKGIQLHKTIESQLDKAMDLQIDKAIKRQTKSVNIKVENKPLTTSGKKPSQQKKNDSAQKKSTVKSNKDKQNNQDKVKKGNQKQNKNLLKKQEKVKTEQDKVKTQDKVKKGQNTSKTVKKQDKLKKEQAVIKTPKNQEQPKKPSGNQRKNPNKNVIQPKPKKKKIKSNSNKRKDIKKTK